MSRPPPEAGEKVGRWTVVRWVARGAQADVFEVFATRLPDLQAALKWSVDTGLADEADLLERVDHDGVVRLLDRGPRDQWIVVGWAHGHAPDAIATLTAGSIAHFGCRLARTLAVLHDQGIVHGDLRAANVRVDQAGVTTLFDLGASLPQTEHPRDIHDLGRLLDAMTERADDVPAGLRSVITACLGQTPPSAAEVAEDLMALSDWVAPPLLTATTVDRIDTEAIPGGNRYRQVRPAGEGGMATVERAWDAWLQRYVAVKRPRTGSILQEARLMSTLHHPRLVRMFDIGKDARGTYLVMEWMPGGTLRDRLSEATDAQMARWLADVALGLEALHETGHGHFDVKPSNILFDARGNARLGDFGLTAAETQPDIGTRPYRPADATPGLPVDIYALGAILHEHLVGLPPQPHIAPLPSGPLSAWCRRALASDPEERPTASQFAVGLRDVAADPGIERVPRRSLPRWVPGVVLMAGIAGLGVTGWLTTRDDPRESPREEAADVRWQRLTASLDTLSSTEANEAVTAFVQEPDIVGTTAAGAAELWRFHHQRAAGEHDAALQAAANAWLWAPESERVEVLLALKDGLFTVGRARHVPGLLSLATDPDAPALAELRQLAHLVQRDFAGASTSGGPWSSIADALGQAHRLEVPIPDQVRIGDALGDARPEIVLERERPHHEQVVFIEPEGEEVGRLDRKSPHHFAYPVDGRVLIAGTDGGTLKRYGAEGWEIVRKLPGHRVLDRDGDRLLLGYPSPGRAFVWDGADAVSEVWEQFPRLHGENEAGAFVDFEGDGSHEIVLNAGQWSAFELWVFEQSGATWVPKTHLPFGYTQAVFELPRATGGALLGTAVHTQYGSRRVFPEGSPYGYPEGLHLFRLQDGDLEVEEHLPVQGSCLTLYRGDLDGDGAFELIGSCRGMLVYTPTAEGWRQVHIPDLHPLAVGQLDGDVADELIVRDDREHPRQLWVLGMGQDRLTPWNHEVHPASDGTTERLAAAGLLPEAADLELALAAGEADPRAARLRAAGWLEQSGRVVRAEEVLDNLGGPGATALEALRQTEGAPGPIVSWDLTNHRFPDGLQVPHAGFVHTGPEGLEVAAVSGNGSEIQIPLVGAETLWVQVDLDVVDLDWSMLFDIALATPAGERLASIRLDGWGGAKLTHLTPAVEVAGVRRSLGRHEPFEATTPVRATLTSTSSGWRALLDVEGVRTELTVDDRPYTGGDVVLQLGSRTRGHPGLAALGRVVVKEIRFGGGIPRGVPDSGAASWLAQHRPLEALAMHDLSIQERLVALEEANRGVEARAVLVEQLPQDAVPPDWLLRLFRTQRYPWHDLLRARLGPEWPRAWSVTLGLEVGSHRASPEGDARVLEALQAPERWEEHVVDARTRRDAVIAKSGALRRTGDIARARAVLNHALQFDDYMGFWRELAKLELTANRPEEARVAARRALETSPVPLRTKRELSALGVVLP